jgi:hypothetical protein
MVGRSAEAVDAEDGRAMGALLLVGDCLAAPSPSLIGQWEGGCDHKRSGGRQIPRLHLFTYHSSITVIRPDRATQSVIKRVRMLVLDAG